MNAHGEPCRFCGERLNELEIGHKLLDGCCFECVIRMLKGKLTTAEADTETSKQKVAQARLLRLQFDSLHVQVERLLRRSEHYECLPNPDPTWEESLDHALATVERLRRERDLHRTESEIRQKYATGMEDAATNAEAQVEQLTKRAEQAERLLAEVGEENGRLTECVAESVRVVAEVQAELKRDLEQAHQELDFALHVVIEADPGHAGLNCCGCEGCEWVKTWLIDNGHLEADGE